MTRIQERLLGFMTMTGLGLFRSKTRWGPISLDAEGPYWRFHEHGDMKRFGRRFFFRQQVVRGILDELTYVFGWNRWCVKSLAGSYRCMEVR